MRFFATAAAVALTLGGSAVLAHPVSSSSEIDVRTSSSRRQDTSVALRIMPLGASITWGTRSDDGNGYRKVLYDSLEVGGFSVDMVGSQRSGNMEDNENEGHPGFKINAVSAAADATIPSQPNLVLINAGTNDCVQNDAVATAHERMGGLLDKLFGSIPGVTVVLSTLLVNADDRVDARVAVVNDGYRQLVRTQRAAGRRVVLAEMNDGKYITRGDLVGDGIHPNKNGYIKMATIWYEAIVNASKEGLIQTPN